MACHENVRNPSLFQVRANARPKRRKQAGIPEVEIFKTKPQIALEMIKDATTAGVPYTWVTGDCVYGDYRDIRFWLENNDKCYVMSVSGKEYVWQGYNQVKVGNILKNLPDDGWICASCGDGSKGARVYDWLVIDINTPRHPAHTQIINALYWFGVVNHLQTKCGPIYALRL